MSAGKRRRQASEDLAALGDPRAAQAEALAGIRRQLKTAARVGIIAAVAIWLLAISFWQGLESVIPLWVAGGLTVAGLGVALLVRRNLAKSQELGQLATGADASPERMQKLEARVAKGDASAILTKAQLEMQKDPKKALATLEGADLNKVQKAMANQIRVTRALIHLNQGELKAARDLCEGVDLDKAPDAKSKANLAAVVAEAWARTGNPIEASEILEPHDPDSGSLEDLRVQLLRARAFAEAHRKRVDPMRKALKELEGVNPQLLAVFVGQKRVHPLLAQEARKRLERSGLVPRPKIQTARR